MNDYYYNIKFIPTVIDVLHSQQLLLLFLPLRCPVCCVFLLYSVGRLSREVQKKAEREK